MLVKTTQAAVNSMKGHMLVPAYNTGCPMLPVRCFWSMRPVSVLAKRQLRKRHTSIISSATANRKGHALGAGSNVSMTNQLYTLMLT